ncbi:MAG: glycosyl hydrolase [Flavobacteriales bacterium]|nr:hypothetical protein [Flavobacteriales bacterium]MCB9449271.1 glycosyl hydrolase [Flavobacteriales bacterium]
MRIFFLIGLFLSTLTGLAQPAWLPVSPVTDASLRGLSTPAPGVIWASGTNATWIQSADDGRTWRVDTIAAAKGLDLRDIQAFDANRALVMTAGSPGMIFLTENGGASWEKVYENTDPSVFLDGMAFNGSDTGYAFGDPMNHYMFVLRTTDGGQTWKAMDATTIPKPLKGEAGFAASGTGIVAMKNTVYIGTGGGEHARVFRWSADQNEWKVFEIPHMQSGEAAGIFSMAFRNDMEGVVVGGSYTDSTNTKGVCAITDDGGQGWREGKRPPRGYRSCVAYHNGMLVAVGRTGSDYSTDGGVIWDSLGTDGYYACTLTDDGGWAVGRGGKMARFIKD